MANHAHPEVLVDTDWVTVYAKDPNVRVVEVDVDTKAYDEGHVPAALAWAWNTRCATRWFAIFAEGAITALMTQSGIDNETTVLLYGDNNNWFAAWPSGKGRSTATRTFAS
jgi:thiosulfate/3-mercaptopyruvate sulfurtransferase